MPFYARQQRVLFGNNGRIDPKNIEDYFRVGGYKALAQVLRRKTPEEVIDEETGYVFDLGVELRAGKSVDSLKEILAEGYDAVFVGTGAVAAEERNSPSGSTKRRSS